MNGLRKNSFKLTFKKKIILNKNLIKELLIFIKIYVQVKNWEEKSLHPVKALLG